MANLVEVKIKGMVTSSRYGSLRDGDIVKTDPEYAKHLVEDCQAGEYVKAGKSDKAKADQEAADKAAAEAKAKADQEAADKAAAEAKAKADQEAADKAAAEAKAKAEQEAADKAAAEAKAKADQEAADKAAAEAKAKAEQEAADKAAAEAKAKEAAEAAAFEKSGLTTDEWNNLADSDRAQRIAAAIKATKKTSNK